MTVSTTYCSTVTLTDYNANADKFYRVYAVGPWTVFQWGARGTVGQFKAQRHASDSAARAAARDQLLAKQGKGYGNLIEDTFQFDPELLDGSKPRCVQLDDVRHAAGVGIPPLPTATGVEIWDPEPTAPELDLHAGFTARALQAITLAVTDPAKGAEEFALLNAAWPELEAAHAKARSYLSTLDSLIVGVSA